jgi:polyprenyl-phospho-N-acetylgalactosaminyl synthase
MNYCLLIPHYNHSQQLSVFLPKLASAGLPCVIVDDGSRDAEIEFLQESIAIFPNIHLFLQRRNRGKGGAVKAGFYHARSLGFTHAVQIDADGQHNIADLDEFIRASKENPSSIICGKPIFDDSAPKARVYGRKVTDFWVALETLSLKIKDGLCGFRVYPLDQVETILDHYFLGSRMDFDTELLVKAVWLNIPLRFINTRVIYPESNVSHFNYLRDNLLLIKLHSRLILGMMIRFPILLMHRIRGH